MPKAGVSAARYTAHTPVPVGPGRGRGRRVRLQAGLYLLLTSVWRSRRLLLTTLAISRGAWLLRPLWLSDGGGRPVDPGRQPATRCGGPAPS